MLLCHCLDILGRGIHNPPHLRNECPPLVPWPNGDSDCVAACSLSQGQRCHWCHLSCSCWGRLGWCGGHDPQRLCCSSSWIRTRRNQLRLEQRWAVAYCGLLTILQSAVPIFALHWQSFEVPWSRIGARKSGCRFANRRASSWPPLFPLHFLSRDRESAIGRRFLGSGACNELLEFITRSWAKAPSPYGPKWWCADRLAPPHLSCHHLPSKPYIFVSLAELSIIIKQFFVFSGGTITKHDFVSLSLWKRSFNFLQGKEMKGRGTTWLMYYPYYLTSSLAFYVTFYVAFYLTYSTFRHFIWHIFQHPIWHSIWY